MHRLGNMVLEKVQPSLVEENFQPPWMVYHIVRLGAEPGLRYSRHSYTTGQEG